ncbi:ABC transporter substrate-binding protein [Sulfitobacter porphyrae]|uniref:ABC transporter substrate-binding protein n=1 Tax=Sulfitobacter porphyrae TaxID=1246864 RepID=A0ABW2B893_9RHOB
MTLEINPKTYMDRRSLLKGLGAVTAATIALPHAARAQDSKTIKIGVISPLTGPLSLFGETDEYTVTKIMALVADGISVNGETYNIEILIRDAQSNPNRAAELGDLILNDEIALMLRPRPPTSTTRRPINASFMACPASRRALPGRPL